MLADIKPTAEDDVIRYYDTKQGIKSFVGVPMFHNNEITGILALDSKDFDAFTIQTIYALGRFVRLLSILITIFEDKFNESRSEIRLKAILSILAEDRNFSNQDEFYEALEIAIKNLIDWDAFAFVYFNPDEQKFKTAKILNKTTLKYVGENLEIELNKTLVGEAIMSGLPVFRKDTSTIETKRFSKSEDVAFDGSFLAVPLIYKGQFYGALCFESLKKDTYSSADIKFILNASRIFSFITYSYSTQNLLKNMLSVDVETKILNYKTFVERLQSDLLKAKLVKLNSGAIALIKIDDFIVQESLFEGNPFHQVLIKIVEIIKDELPEFSLFGRLSEKILCVYFFNLPSNDAYLWAEKLRVKIARHPMAVNIKQTTYTISAGVASTINITDVDIALHNAELALNKALEKNGNKVVSI